MARWLLLLVFLFTSCATKSEEDRIREVVRAALEGVNERKLSQVVENAVPEFKGPKGANLDECRRVILGYLLQQGWLGAFERKLEVVVDGDTATATLEAILARGNPVEKLEDVVPTNAAVYGFDLRLEKRSGDWKLVGADYRNLSW